MSLTPLAAPAPPFTACTTRTVTSTFDSASGSACGSNSWFLNYNLPEWQFPSGQHRVYIAADITAPHNVQVDTFTLTSGGSIVNSENCFTWLSGTKLGIDYSASNTAYKMALVIRDGGVRPTWFEGSTITLSYINTATESACVPPMTDCGYGTRKKSTADNFVFITDAFLTSLKALWAWTRLGGVFSPYIGQVIDVDTLCASPPAVLEPFQVSDLFTIGLRGLKQLQIMAWWQLCECIPGPGAPTQPAKPPLVEDPALPSDQVFVVNPTNPCLDITEVRRKLDELLRLVQLDYQTDTHVQRQLVPGDTVRGSSFAALSGAGSFSIAAAIGVQAIITHRPPGGRELEGAPNYVWDLGWLSIMDDNGFIEERRLTRDVEVWMPRLMSDATTFGYFLKEGVTANITILYPVL